MAFLSICSYGVCTSLFGFLSLSLFFFAIPQGMWDLSSLSRDGLGASLIAQLVKDLPTIQETLVRFLGQEDSPREMLGYPLQYSWAFLVPQMIKNPPAMWETWIQSLG